MASSKRGSADLRPLRDAHRTRRRAAARAIVVVLICWIWPGPRLWAQDRPPPSADAPPAPQQQGPPLPPAIAPERHSLDSADRQLVERRQAIGDLEGRPIRAVTVETLGKRWAGPGSAKKPQVRGVRVGQRLTEALARKALQELLQTGAYARGYVDARPIDDGVILRIVVLPRRVVATIRLDGDEFNRHETLAAAEIDEGDEITEPMFHRIAGRLRRFYAQRGYDAAAISVTAVDTDDPLQVLLRIDIEPGERRTIWQRIFVVDPVLDPVLGALKQDYEVEAGDAWDEDALSQADLEMTNLLHEELFLEAQVQHRVLVRGPYTYLYVYLDSGPQYRFEFEGQHSFDADALLETFKLETNPETNAEQLAERLRNHYIVHGFYDATVKVTEQAGPGQPYHVLHFQVREGTPMQVTRHLFPCLPADAEQYDLSVDDLQQEIDGILQDTLPEPPLFTPVDSHASDQPFGPAQAGSRARALRLQPAMVYSPEAYDQVVRHLRDLVNSQGFLNAVVGPASLLRARCDPASHGPGCRALPLPGRAAPVCQADALGLPMPEPELGEAYTCRPDPLRSIHCASTATVQIPIFLGPRTRLYDLTMEGNHQWSARELTEVAELPLGGPLSNIELDAARQRLLNHYRDAGYAYAEVRTRVELSPDRTRARARFVINEHEPVVISGYEVHGARRTDPDLIISRLALCQDLTECAEEERYYKRTLVRKSEEQIATLGTFTSVTISLEDPEIPQKNKRVIITVVEQPSQYLEPRVGFSTGEGLRMAFEYGHRNIAGEAVALTVRLEFSVLPDLLIFEDDVREKYQRFTISERLERRNSATLRFPEVGLGPLVALTIDGIDVRDNQRDYALTKEALIPTLSYAPLRTLRFQLAASVELNDVQVFGAESVEQAIQQNAGLAKYLRVPDGRTIALAQRLGVIWDRRDNAFAATEGTLFGLDVEHVHAFPSDDSATIESEFLRFSGRSAGYLKLTDSGLVLAISVAGGYNLQLTDDSQTYPDRLFYLGGVDSVRGFPLDSVVPEDVAQRVLSGSLPIETVAVRGGDLYINPRVELRVPLSEIFGLGLFLDTGNVWADESAIESPTDLLQLRYAAGTGVRIATPIGPVAVDFGLNLVRRQWEDFAAGHFSIGLF